VPTINGAASNPESHAALCPSAKCEPGVLLLGIVEADGSVAFLKQKLRVDEFFTRIALEGRTPEKRFRFAGTCRKSGCQQWTGERCGVIDRLFADNPAFRSSGDLPDCGIRVNCRWFSQWGEKACGICPHVITDMTTTGAS